MMKIGKNDSFVFAEKEVLGCVLTSNTKRLVKFIIKLDEKNGQFLEKKLISLLQIII